MTNLSLFKRGIRKLQRMFHSSFRKHYSPNKLRKRKARTIGKRLQLKQNGYIFTCKTLKPSFYLPLYRQDYIQQEILTEGNYYEFENLDFICKHWDDGKVRAKIENGTLVDIGANIGNHTLYFFFECGIKKAYCFEPITSTFNILQKNITINSLEKKTKLINCAVGATESMASVSHYEKENIGATQISVDDNGRIPLIKLDSLQIEDVVDIIKIDVEGFEKQVIQGCLETINKNKPFILIEIQPENLDSICNTLHTIGYHHIQLIGINYLFYV